MISFSEEKNSILKGKTIWDEWTRDKDFSLKDYVCIALDDEIELYCIAAPFFKYLKDRKGIDRCFVITNCISIFDYDNDGVDDILCVPDKNDMEAIINYFRIISGFSNITLLSCKNKYGCGLEEYFANGMVSKSEYVKIALLDLGGLL